MEFCGKFLKESVCINLLQIFNKLSFNSLFNACLQGANSSI